MKRLAFICFLCTTSFGFAQLDHPKSSPAAQVSQEVGFTKITVDYSRPAARGRTIFGELVPYGRIWRVGANQSTKISVDSDIEVAGNTLTKGTYALYAFPEKEAWEIVFHKNTSHWGDGRKNYNPEEDAFRVTINPKVTETHQENFLISFDNITHDSCQMIWHWAKTKVVIPISVNTRLVMEQKIEKALQPGPSAQTYYEVARYYVEQKTNYEKALNYLNKAITLGGDTYYFHRVKSLAQAALGQHSAAIISAKKSLKIAESLGKDEFVRMNQKNIDLWSRKRKN